MSKDIMELFESAVEKLFSYMSKQEENVFKDFNVILKNNHLKECSSDTISFLRWLYVRDRQFSNISFGEESREKLNDEDKRNLVLFNIKLKSEYGMKTFKDITLAKSLEEEYNVSFKKAKEMRGQQASLLLDKNKEKELSKVCIDKLYAEIQPRGMKTRSLNNFLFYIAILYLPEFKDLEEKPLHKLLQKYLIYKDDQILFDVGSGVKSDFLKKSIFMNTKYALKLEGLVRIPYTLNLLFSSSHSEESTRKFMERLEAGHQYRLVSFWLTLNTIKDMSNHEIKKYFYYSKIINEARMKLKEDTIVDEFLSHYTESGLPVHMLNFENNMFEDKRELSDDYVIMCKTFCSEFIKYPRLSLEIKIHEVIPTHVFYDHTLELPTWDF
jgi:hypothetical protein